MHISAQLRSAAKTCEEVDANLMNDAANHIEYLERVHVDAIRSLDSIRNSLRAVIPDTLVR